MPSQAVPIVVVVVGMFVTFMATLGGVTLWVGAGDRGQRRKGG